MTKILFVCHGNICRSPMAEFVMKDLVAKAGVADEFEIASVAVSWEEIGNPVYPPARRELARHGLTCDGKFARQITTADLDTYDYIYYMDSRNRQNLGRMFPKFDRFLPFLDRDVADPWYSGDFTQTWADICEGCRRILVELHGLKSWKESWRSCRCIFTAVSTQKRWNFRSGSVISAVRNALCTIRPGPVPRQLGR